MNKTLATAVGILALAGLIGYYLYLQNSRYGISSAGKGPGDVGVAYVLDRKTGKTWMLLGANKVPHDEPQEAVELRDVPLDQLRKLQGTAEVSGSKLWCTLYNGSDWRIREILVNVQVLDDNSQSPVLERRYRLAKEYFIDPLKAGVFEAYVGFDLQAAQRITCQIKSAKGGAAVIEPLNKIGRAIRRLTSACALDSRPESHTIPANRASVIRKVVGLNVRSRCALVEV
jgi:hypothetical protein